MSNAEIVKGLALVVERGQSNSARGGEVSRDRDAVGPGNALREHERRELLPAERASVAKHSDVEILVKRDLTRLECADRLLVPVLKIILAETEPLHRRHSLLAIPAVAAEHAANVEQDEVDRRRHPTCTAWSGSPSSPTRRSGRTRSSYVTAAG